LSFGDTPSVKITLTFGYLLESAHSRVAWLSDTADCRKNGEVPAQQSAAGDDYRLQPNRATRRRETIAT
jgi:hypothetical protein